MVIVSGPQISTTTLYDARIEQISPTILQAMGLPLLSQFVTKPLPAFIPDSPLATTTHEPSRERADLDSVVEEITI